MKHVLEFIQYLIYTFFRAEQAPGFALIIDRRLADFSSNVRVTFQKIVTLFPGMYLNDLNLFYDRLNT